MIIYSPRTFVNLTTHQSVWEHTSSKDSLSDIKHNFPWRTVQHEWVGRLVNGYHYNNLLFVIFALLLPKTFFKRGGGQSKKKQKKQKNYYFASTINHKGRKSFYDPKDVLILFPVTQKMTRKKFCGKGL